MNIGDYVIVTWDDGEEEHGFITCISGELCYIHFSWSFNDITFKKSRVRLAN